ncbi:MAG: hypothetical protein J6T54_12495 [Fibrobacter sp.]|nr:hypothetical protein [Fibrobacter sp.]
MNLLDALVDFFEKLAEKYNFDEEEQAEFRELLFSAENARNDSEPMYDSEATEMVEEEEVEEDGEED